MIKIKYMYSRNPPNKNNYYVCHDKSDLRTSPLALASLRQEKMVPTVT